MRLQPQIQQALATGGRRVAPAVALDPQLGPLAPLPGIWRSTGQGWNMMALPFAAPSGPPFRLLLNQFDETIAFTLADKAVPNRGVASIGGFGGVAQVAGQDQFTVTLDYEQVVHQVAAADLPASGLAGGEDLAIHHEIGLWLFMANQVGEDVDVARLASVPHGSAVLALGTSDIVEDPDPAMLIPRVSGLPGKLPNDDIDDPANRHLWPYKAFHDQPFKGAVGGSEFPGFDPVDPSAPLRRAIAGLDIARTTILHVDTTTPGGGIHNIPFIARQADARRMVSTFWIHELKAQDRTGHPRMVLQYLQDVSLEFLDSLNGGLIRWPHISIDTLEKVAP
jgi:hypothetical protein